MENIAEIYVAISYTGMSICFLVVLYYKRKNK